ncbi:MAG: hypothetical protein IJV99_02905, partial [Clostridia bacterium]|nr:hypothetical protein [Clostridia bacterium]
MVKIICTDAYSDLFPVLVKELEGKVNSVEGKNLIFCEEKISLMAERAIVSRFNGSFNTQVYSFGNYFRSKRPNGKTLSKEGSAMAVKRVLSSVKLDAFKPSRATLAPSLFELIIQLKSAKVGVEELERATNECSGVLKSKLKDVTEVYKGYENFIKENGFDDQSSMLNYLPEIIENDQDIKGADVYIVGFNGWTSQLRAGIVALLRNARSVTAILVSGANEMVYVGETEQAFISACQTAGVPFIKQNASPSLEIEGKIISENLFNPTGFKGKYNTEKVFISTAENKYDECEQVARIARALVLNGKCRYKNITVAIPDINGYREELEKAFTKLEVPFFLDEKKKVGAHPLVRLAISYLEIKRKNMQRSVVTDFFKNPLFTADKKLADEFDNYILRYNVNYSRFKKPFNFPHDGEYTLEQLNAFREKLVECQNAPNIKTLFDMLSVKERLVELSERLNELVELEERAINEQIYDKVITLADEMDSILGGVNLSLPEIKEILLSGFSAMELSIIPQYNDAVFVGGYKQTALAKADYLFALGLTQDVPSIRNDVALLSDGDISVLEEIKVMVEPKIRVVNHREREHVALALSAFNKGLFVSYPLTAINGDKAFKGEVFSFIENTFTTKKPKNLSGYTTYKDGLSTF